MVLLRRDVFREEYLSSVMHPLDRDHGYEKYEEGLWIKHQVAHHVCPEVIVELGVRAGYSAWAMLRAAPEARYVGFDDFSINEAVLDLDVGEVFKAHAEGLLAGYNAELVTDDIYRPGFVVPVADLYHVDANHGFLHALHDLVTCASVMKASSVVAVHDYWYPVVQGAVHKAAVVFDMVVTELIEERNGDALLTCGGSPDWLSCMKTRHVEVESRVCDTSVNLPCVYVTGCARSGTSLVQVLLHSFEGLHGEYTEGYPYKVSAESGRIVKKPSSPEHTENATKSGFHIATINPGSVPRSHRARSTLCPAFFRAADRYMIPSGSIRNSLTMNNTLT